jgi:hypothetical protein
LWFLNTHLVIPIARISAANWVYQFATFSACLGIIQIPYNSAIISHERMSFYASLAITEGSLDLLVAFSLRWFGVDKLVFYAILIFVVLIPIFVARKLYCNKLFPALKFRLVSDRMLFWEILGFSGWSLWGSVATMSATQGVNMLLNMFFGVTVNAAMGIASQVAGGLNGFVSNFQMAYRPQIVKSFAKCERGILLDMIFTSARMSVLLLFLFAAPVIMNMRFVLALWLKVVIGPDVDDHPGHWADQMLSAVYQRSPGAEYRLVLHLPAPRVPAGDSAVYQAWHICTVSADPPTVHEGFGRFSSLRIWDAGRGQGGRGHGSFDYRAHAGLLSSRRVLARAERG